MRTARPRRDGGAGAVRPALDARLEGEFGVRPICRSRSNRQGSRSGCRSVTVATSGSCCQKPPASWAAWSWQLRGGPLCKVWVLPAANRDPAGMVRAGRRRHPGRGPGDRQMNCRMLLAYHFQFDKAPKLVIAGDAAHLNPPWVATATTPALATRSMWPGNWPHASTAGPVRTCWPVTNQNAGRSRRAHRRRNGEQQRPCPPLRRRPSRPGRTGRRSGPVLNRGSPPGEGQRIPLPGTGPGLQLRKLTSGYRRRRNRPT